MPGVVGYLGQDLTAATGIDPQTITAESATAGDLTVLANQPSTAINNGDVAEFEIADPVVALQGSGTADAPNIVVTVNASGFQAVNVAYNLRDVDASIDNATQPVALQYRVGTTGNFVNVPAAFVADATTGPSLATLVTPVSAGLPPAADNQPVVQVRIITTNAASNDEWVGIDDINITGTPLAGLPMPVASCPAALTTPQGSAASAPVSASDTDSQFSSAQITSAAVPGISLTGTTVGVNSITSTLSVAGTAAPGTYPVVIRFTTTDAQTVDCTVQVAVIALVKISQVQGPGATSPVAGQTVAVEGIVTSLFTTADVVSGFFVQEEVADYDADPNTSEGVFVNCGATCSPAVAIGNVARITGAVSETFNRTRITASSILVQSSGNPLPAATSITLPAAGSTRSTTTFENIEGMVVTVTTPLQVTEFFEEARFGHLVLTSGTRPYTYTHVDPTPTPAEFTAFVAELDKRRIYLDDDNNDANDAISGPQSNERFPYPTPGLSVSNRMRAVTPSRASRA